MIAVDTWAFVEIARRGPRWQEVMATLRGAARLVTARDVIAETFTLLTSRSRSSSAGWRWLSGLDPAIFNVRDPALAEVRAFMAGQDRAGNISFGDFALAMAAREAGARDVATADRGFRRLGLNPLFAS